MTRSVKNSISRPSKGCRGVGPTKGLSRRSSRRQVCGDVLAGVRRTSGHDGANLLAAIRALLAGGPSILQRHSKREIRCAVFSRSAF